MCEEIRFAMLISTVTPTFSCSKMCSNTKADAAILDVVVRKNKAFNSCFIKQVLLFIINFYYIYIYFPHAVSV